VKAHQGRSTANKRENAHRGRTTKRNEGKQPTGAETSKKDEIEYTYKNKKLQ